MGVFNIIEYISKLIDKFTSNRKEQYYNQLKQLEVEYAKALQENRDTDAAIIRKKMKQLRLKLNISGDDL